MNEAQAADAQVVGVAGGEADTAACIVDAAVAAHRGLGAAEAIRCEHDVPTAVRPMPLLALRLPCCMPSSRGGSTAPGAPSCWRDLD
jgi:hypothetical protein